MLDDYAANQMASFFRSIAPWRGAYRYAWLTYVGLSGGGVVKIISARIYLSLLPPTNLKELFVASKFQAGQFLIEQNESMSVEDVISKLMSPEGFSVDGHGILMLPSDERNKPSFSVPVILHPEGLNAGNRLAVLTASSVHLHGLTLQPETDWALKAGAKPYDSFNELTQDYGLGTAYRDQATFEVVAPCAVEVFAHSLVSDTTALLGVWTATSVDSKRLRLNYRVLDKGIVVARESIPGTDLKWEAAGSDTVNGLINVAVPRGSLIQCIACYEGQAHHQRWFSDPKILQNPRNAVLSIVDPSLRQIQSYLMPDQAKGKAADDFETAVTWMLWALGFSSINLGLHPKTRDAFDVLAVSPNGDFLVVECTLGLLKADSKLSKLGMRASQVRKVLDQSQMQHLKVIPVIVTAMSREEISGDLSAAEEMGILVLTRSELEASLTEVLKFPNADMLVETALRNLKKKDMGIM